MFGQWVLKMLQVSAGVLSQTTHFRGSSHHVGRTLKQLCGKGHMGSQQPWEGAILEAYPPALRWIQPPTDTFTATSWEALILTHRSCEISNVCCPEQLNFRVICYAAIDNWCSGCLLLRINKQVGGEVPLTLNGIKWMLTICFVCIHLPFSPQNCDFPLDILASCLFSVVHFGWDWL